MIWNNVAPSAPPFCISYLGPQDKPLLGERVRPSTNFAERILEDIAMNKAILDAIENRLTTWLLKRSIPLYSQIPPTASAIPASPELGLRQPLRACFNQRPSPSPGRMRSPILLHPFELVRGNSPKLPLCHGVRAPNLPIFGWSPRKSS